MRSPEFWTSQPGSSQAPSDNSHSHDFSASLAVIVSAIVAEQTIVDVSSARLVVSGLIEDYCRAAPGGSGARAEYLLSAASHLNAVAMRFGDSNDVAVNLRKAGAAIAAHAFESPKQIDKQSADTPGLLGQVLAELEKTTLNRGDVLKGLIGELQVRALITASEAEELKGFVEIIDVSHPNTAALVKKVQDKAKTGKHPARGSLAEALTNAAVQASRVIGVAPIGNGPATPKSPHSKLKTPESLAGSGVPPVPASRNADVIYGAIMGGVIGGLAAGVPGAVGGAYLGILAGVVVGEIEHSASNSTGTGSTESGSEGDGGEGGSDGDGEGEGDGGEGDGGEGGSEGGGDGGGGGCFTGNTPVLMADGFRKNIDAIVAGDMVLARDETTGVTEVQSVTRTFRHVVGETLVLRLNGDELIETTATHRFGTAKGGFTGAAKLRPGSKLSTSNDAGAELVGMQTRSREAIVYNLSIDNFQTFFVGQAGLWVHNLKDDELPLPDPE
jgi:hypothetical protein